MKHKHLTYDDRLIIQQELENSTSLHKIAQRLHKSDSTISHEIIRNRYQVKASASHTALCARVNVCAMVNLCSANWQPYKLRQLCRGLPHSPLPGLPAALLHAPYQGSALLQRLPAVGCKDLPGCQVPLRCQACAGRRRRFTE